MKRLLHLQVTPIWIEVGEDGRPSATEAGGPPWLVHFHEIGLLAARVRAIEGAEPAACRPGNQGEFYGHTDPTDGTETEG